jgi:hypothetical protein
MSLLTPLLLFSEVELCPFQVPMLVINNVGIKDFSSTDFSQYPLSTEDFTELKIIIVKY